MPLRFLSSEVVRIIHKDLLRRYGGQPGLRDLALLESALAQPKATYGGKFLHKTLFDKAAAYGFHLCQNHPFVDGNKRIALVVMDLFLQINGWEMVATEEEAYAAIMDLARGKLSKTKLAQWLRKRGKRRGR